MSLGSAAAAAAAAVASSSSSSSSASAPSTSTMSPIAAAMKTQVNKASKNGTLGLLLAELIQLANMSQNQVLEKLKLANVMLTQQRAQNRAYGHAGVDASRKQMELQELHVLAAARDRLAALKIAKAGAEDAAAVASMNEAQRKAHDDAKAVIQLRETVLALQLLALGCVRVVVKVRPPGSGFTNEEFIQIDQNRFRFHEQRSFNAAPLDVSKPAPHGTKWYDWEKVLDGRKAGKRVTNTDVFNQFNFLITAIDEYQSDCGLFAFGASGAGKTYTMIGPAKESDASSQEFSAAAAAAAASSSSSADTEVDESGLLQMFCQHYINDIQTNPNSKFSNIEVCALEFAPFDGGFILDDKQRTKLKAIYEQRAATSTHLTVLQKKLKEDTGLERGKKFVMVARDLLTTAADRKTPYKYFAVEDVREYQEWCHVGVKEKKDRIDARPNKYPLTGDGKIDINTVAEILRNQRLTRATALNDESSRTHACVHVMLQRKDNPSAYVHLIMVDLCGYELNAAKLRSTVGFPGNFLTVQKEETDAMGQLDPILDKQRIGIVTSLDHIAETMQGYATNDRKSDGYRSSKFACDQLIKHMWRVFCGAADSRIAFMYGLNTTTKAGFPFATMKTQYMAAEFAHKFTMKHRQNDQRTLKQRQDIERKIAERVADAQQRMQGNWDAYTYENDILHASTRKLATEYDTAVKLVDSCNRETSKRAFGVAVLSKQGVEKLKLTKTEEEEMLKAKILLESATGVLSQKIHENMVRVAARILAIKYNTAYNTISTERQQLLERFFDKDEMPETSTQAQIDAAKHNVVSEIDSSLAAAAANDRATQSTSLQALTRALEAIIGINLNKALKKTEPDAQEQRASAVLGFDYWEAYKATEAETHRILTEARNAARMIHRINVALQTATDLTAADLADAKARAAKWVSRREEDKIITVPKTLTFAPELLASKEFMEDVLKLREYLEQSAKWQPRLNEIFVSYESTSLREPEKLEVGTDDLNLALVEQLQRSLVAQIEKTVSASDDEIDRKRNDLVALQKQLHAKFDVDTQNILLRSSAENGDALAELMKLINSIQTGGTETTTASSSSSSSSSSSASSSMFSKLANKVSGMASRVAKAMKNASTTAGGAAGNAGGGGGDEEGDEEKYDGEDKEHEPPQDPAGGGDEAVVIFDESTQPVLVPPPFELTDRMVNSMQLQLIYYAQQAERKDLSADPSDMFVSLIRGALNDTNGGLQFLLHFPVVDNQYSNERAILQVRQACAALVYLYSKLMERRPANPGLAVIPFKPIPRITTSFDHVCNALAFELTQLAAKRPSEREALRKNSIAYRRMMRFVLVVFVAIQAPESGFSLTPTRLCFSYLQGLVAQLPAVEYVVNEEVQIQLRNGPLQARFAALTEQRQTHLGKQITRDYTNAISIQSQLIAMAHHFALIDEQLIRTQKKWDTLSVAEQDAAYILIVRALSEDVFHIVIAKAPDVETARKACAALIFIYSKLLCCVDGRFPLLPYKGLTEVTRFDDLPGKLVAEIKLVIQMTDQDREKLRQESDSFRTVVRFVMAASLGSRATMPDVFTQPARAVVREILDWLETTQGTPMHQKAHDFLTIEQARLDEKTRAAFAIADVSDVEDTSLQPQPQPPPQPQPRLQPGESAVVAQPRKDIVAAVLSIEAAAAVDTRTLATRQSYANDILWVLNLIMTDPLYLHEFMRCSAEQRNRRCQIFFALYKTISDSGNKSRVFLKHTSDPFEATTTELQLLNAAGVVAHTLYPTVYPNPIPKLQVVGGLPALDIACRLVAFMGWGVESQHASPTAGAVISCYQAFSTFYNTLSTQQRDAIILYAINRVRDDVSKPPPPSETTAVATTTTTTTAITAAPTAGRQLQPESWFQLRLEPPPPAQQQPRLPLTRDPQPFQLSFLSRVQESAPTQATPLPRVDVRQQPREQPLQISSSALPPLEQTPQQSYTQPPSQLPQQRLQQPQPLPNPSYRALEVLPPAQQPAQPQPRTGAPTNPSFLTTASTFQVSTTFRSGAEDYAPFFVIHRNLSSVLL